MSHHPALPESAYSALGLPPSVVRILMNPKPPPPSISAPELHQNATDFEDRLPENVSHIMLYAELLLHIRTITLFASLRSHHTRETKARLDADGNVITVSHEGHRATIRLPLKVDGKGDAALELPAQPPSKEITLRLQMEEQDDSDMLGMMAEARKANIVPWDGGLLGKQEGMELRCKNCEGVVLQREAVREWKDLPNENWAEMMDFWHCHKPDEHHLHGHEHEVGGLKGYAAGNRLKAAQGVGFVDLTGFLLSEQDCAGAKVRTLSLHIMFTYKKRAQRRQTRQFPWHSRRYNRPRLICTQHYPSAGLILCFGLMGRQRWRASGLKFHCLYTLRFLGLAGWS